MLVQHGGCHAQDTRRLERRRSSTRSSGSNAPAPRASSRRSSSPISAEVIEFLKYELPEMKIFYFSDPNVDCLGILKEIQEDPWLHYGGIIGIHDNMDDKKLLEAMRDANIIAVLRKKEFMSNLPAPPAHRPPEQADPLPARHPAAPAQDHLGRLRHRQRSPRYHHLHEPGHQLPLQLQPHRPGREGEAPRRPPRAPHQRHRARQLQDRLRREDRLARAERRHHGAHPREEQGPGGQGPQGLLLLHDHAREDRASRSGTRARASTGAPGWRASPTTPGLHGMGMKMANLYVRDLSYNEKGNEVAFEIEHQEGRVQRHPEDLRALGGGRLQGRRVHLLGGRGVRLPLLHRLGHALRLLEGQVRLLPDARRPLHGRDVLPAVEPALGDRRRQGPLRR